MTRIIAGRFGGRRLEVPKGDGTRPTTDRVRESLFSSLESELGGFDGLWVLDLFAGSGALGLEAISRGAAGGVFVDSDARAVSAIKKNVRELGITTARVVKGSAGGFATRPHDGPIDLVLIDPPYAVTTDAVTSLVRRIAVDIAPGALFVVERSTRDPFTWPDEVEAVRSRKYGETTLWYGRAGERAGGPLVESPA